MIYTHFSSQCHRKGHPVVCLEVTENNANALKFYQKLGFAELAFNQGMYTSILTQYYHEYYC